jgi:glycosyltransferase 2 family protein
VKKRPWLRPLLTAVFYVILVVFLVVYLLNIDFSVFATTQIAWWYLIAAAAFALSFRYWQTFIWITVLRGLGATGVRMNAELTFVYAKSWLGRYVPGTAPWILGKIYFASQHGVSKAKLAVGSLLEGAIQVAVLLATSAILLLLDPRLDVVDPSIKLVMVVVVVGAVVGLLPPVFNWLMSLAFRLLRRPALSAENRVRGRTILIAAGQYLFGAALSGLSLYFIVKAIYPDLPISDLLFVVAAGNLAGAASMLAFFAPGGIGVRETIQLVLLGVVVPKAIAVVAVVLTRLWGITMDLAFFGITRLALTIARRRRGPSATPTDVPED